MLFTLQGFVREYLGRQRVRALIRPAQRRLGISASRRIDERFQCWNQVRMRLFMPTSPPAVVPNFHNVVVGLSTVAYLSAAERHRADRQPRRMRHPSNVAASASAPAHRRRARSSIVAVSRRHFRRISFSASTANVDHVGAILSIIPNRPHSVDLFLRGPLTFPRPFPQLPKRHDA
jgi:hypothetical protein